MVCSENDINPIIQLPICGRKIKLRTKQSRQGFFRYIWYIAYYIEHIICGIWPRFYRIARLNSGIKNRHHLWAITTVSKDSQFWMQKICHRVRGPYIKHQISWAILYGPYYIVHVIYPGPYYTVHIIWSVLNTTYHIQLSFCPCPYSSDLQRGNIGCLIKSS